MRQNTANDMQGRARRAFWTDGDGRLSGGADGAHRRHRSGAAHTLDAGKRHQPT